MLARLRRLMYLDQNDDADRRGPSDDPGSTSPTSKKLREKLQMLADWRIDSSSIEFEEDADEYRGGYAAVSRAFLVCASGTESLVDNSAHAGRDNNSGGGTIGTRKTVAVKKMKIENGKNKERVLGLALREAGFLTQLSHTNIIKPEGFVEDLSEDRVWLVFPWADNGNLKDFAASEDWEIPERIWLIHDVTRGVEYLHSRDPPIYHGDLKSANVVVNSKCRAVITDFGSARRLAKKEPTDQPRATESENRAQPELLLDTNFCEATNTVTLTGNKYTLRWAAPELLLDDDPGLWSDIWALGWIFYEVMTNSIPFEDVRKDSVVIIRVIRGNLPSVGGHARMVLMRTLYSLMNTCWNIDPSKRPTAEHCIKSMNYMPRVVPSPRQVSNPSGSRTRSPKLLLKLGKMHQSQHDYINAWKYYIEALGICAGSADIANGAEAFYYLGKVRMHQKQYNQAVMLYSEAAHIFAHMNHQQGRARTLLGLADVHRRREEYSEGITFYSEAIQIFTDVGDKHKRTDALWGLADVYRHQKQYKRAAELFSETLQIYIDSGDGNGRARSLEGLARIHRDQGQHEDAMRLYEQAAQIYEALGRTPYAACALDRAARARRELEPEAE